MRTVKIGRVSLGVKPVKVLVSLEGPTARQLYAKARALEKKPVDILEWRMDSFQSFECEKLCATYKTLKEKTKKPVLCTLRTTHEGGKADLSRSEYKTLLTQFLNEARPDAIDIEFGRGDIEKLIALAKKLSIPVIASFHDFKKTPPETLLCNKLKRMKDIGADVLKIAVMPKSENDVLKLFSVLLRAKTLNRPVIAIAMGELGKLSRVTGNIFGSCATFASLGNTSAPGQIDLEQTQTLLNLLS